MNRFHLVLFAFLIVPFFTSAKSSSCTIKGKVLDTDSGFVLIRNLTKPLPDSVAFRKGEFEYKGVLDEITPYVITDPSNRYQLFFAEPNSTMLITLKKKEFQVISIEGSAPQDIYYNLLMKQGPYQRSMDQLKQALYQASSNKDSIQKKLGALGNEMNANFYTFLKDHGNSEVASFLVYSSITQDHGIDAHLADSMFSYLNGKGKTSFYGRESQKSIEKLRAVTVGYIAPDFTLPDSSTKKKYSLSSFRGKYVLVDFWASWCGPCKAEIPFIKQAYAKYHDKGFDVFSVSLDEKRDAWLNALKQFEMPWTQVSDSKGFRSIVNDLYPIPSIPKTLLLDKEGKIIATDLRGYALDLKLEELLGK